MANYHLHASVVKRSEGRSATAAAAYRSATEIVDERTGETHDYTRKGGVVHSEIVLPEGAPERFRDRSELWNAAELAESRRDAQVAREFEGSLPNELSREDHIEIAREFARGLADRGMCADVCIHDRGDGNPHFHILATTRDVDGDGFGVKNREWNDKSLIVRERERFADIQNRALEREGREERVDHRSYSDRGIDLEPTRHEGPIVRKIEEREMRACEREGREYRPVTDVRRENVEIEARNRIAERLQERIEELREQAREIAERIREAVERFQRVFDRIDEMRDMSHRLLGMSIETMDPVEDMRLERESDRLDELVDKAVDRMRDEYMRLDDREAEAVKHGVSGRSWDIEGSYFDDLRRIERGYSYDSGRYPDRDMDDARHAYEDQEHDRSDGWAEREIEYEIEYER